MLKWVYIFWPSFATAIVGEAVFFAFINLARAHLDGETRLLEPARHLFGRDSSCSGV